MVTNNPLLMAAKIIAIIVFFAMLWTPTFIVWLTGMERICLP
jgi:hypothetical protein